MSKRTWTMVGLAGAVVLLLAVLLGCQGSQPGPATPQSDAPSQDWPTSTPEDQGFDSVKLAEGLQAMHDQGVPIDSLLVLRNGAVVLDAYFAPYDDTIPHNLASVTKSVMTTLIGIAADQGKLQLDQPVLSFFPNRMITNRDARKEAMTVRHLAGMVNGFQSGCLAGDVGTLEAMRSNPDWVQAALDRKVVADPGSRFCYDSPGMHLLSAIVQQATGMTALEFARENLFTPLGIDQVAWPADPQGYNHGWGDLHLAPRDAAKIGYLWLNDGAWHGQQIVSADWVQDSVTAHVASGRGDHYGYGWWVGDDDYFASGRGGQTIRIVPSWNTVVVVTGYGVAFDQVASYLTAAFVDPEKPLPANPQGVNRLAETVAALAEAPAAPPAAPLPTTARTISGQTYRFGINLAELHTIRFEFADSDQAVLELTLDEPVRRSIWPVGLDGKYRVGDDGQAARGYWQDAQTFVLDLFDIGQRTIRFRFEDDRVQVTSPAMGLDVEGRLEDVGAGR